MERREFLKLGAGAGILSAALPSAPGLGAHVALARPTPERDLERHLAHLDRTLVALDRGSLFGDILGAAVPTVTLEHAVHMERLSKTAMRTLAVLGMFRDLDEAQRRHAAVQERMWQAMPEMDEAVLGTAEFLGTLDHQDYRRVQARLKRDPDIVMRLGGIFDRHARALGVSLKPRFHLRKLLADVSWRLQKQSLLILVNECLTKVRKMAARLDAVGDPHTLTVARAAHAPRYQARLRALIRGYDLVPGSTLGVFSRERPGESLAVAAAVDGAAVPAGETVVSPSMYQTSDKGRQLVGMGALLLGIGLVGGVLSVNLLETLGWQAFFGTTAAVVLIVSGIVILAVAVATS